MNGGRAGGGPSNAQHFFAADLGGNVVAAEDRQRIVLALLELVLERGADQGQQPRHTVRLHSKQLHQRLHCILVDLGGDGTG